MRIVEDTPHRLVIEHFPWLLAGFVWLLGMTTLAVGILGVQTDGVLHRVFLTLIGAGVTLSGAVLFPFVRITFDRRTRTVELRNAYVDRARVRTTPLGRLRRIRQQAEWSDSARLVRLVLELDDGTIIPLETGFSSVSRDKIADKASFWLTRAGGEIDSR